MKTSRLLEFDVLRVAAMLYVVAFFHLFAYFDALRPIVENPVIDMLSRVALGTFVFISAYLLASRNKVENWGDVKTFLTKRFLRVYPLFFLALVGFLIAKYIKLHLFVTVALLMTMLTGRNISTLWFVTMLFLFYLATPVYLYKSSPLKTVLLTTVLYFGLISVHRFTGRIDMRLPMYLPIFVAGILAAQRPKFWAAFSNIWLIAGGVLLFAGVMQFILPVRVVTQPDSPSEVMWISLIVLGALPFCIALARFGSRVIPAKPLLVLSNASFAMYLLHRLTYRPLLKLYDPQQVPHILLYSYLVLVPLTFLLAIGIQNTYDGVLNRLFPVPRRA